MSFAKRRKIKSGAIFGHGKGYLGFAIRKQLLLDALDEEKLSSGVAQGSNFQLLDQRKLNSQAAGILGCLLGRCDVGRGGHPVVC